MNYFLNTDRKLYPTRPPSAFAHVGNGTNIIYVDPENNLVVVAAWIENAKIDEFIGKLNASLK
jgi:CubicO group peptidase (beta-lactamase class C family)